MHASSNDLIFALPTGYIEQRNGEVIILAPATTNERDSAHAADAQQRPPLSVHRLHPRRASSGRKGPPCKKFPRHVDPAPVCSTCQ
jgi:hypothetical protein